MYDYKKALESFEKAKKIQQENNSKLQELRKSMGAHYMNIEFNVDDITVNCILIEEEFDIDEENVEIWPVGYSEDIDPQNPITITLEELKKRNGK